MQCGVLLVGLSKTGVAPPRMAGRGAFEGACWEAFEGETFGGGGEFVWWGGEFVGGGGEKEGARDA